MICKMCAKPSKRPLCSFKCVKARNEERLLRLTELAWQRERKRQARAQ